MQSLIGGDGRGLLELEVVLVEALTGRTKRSATVYVLFEAERVQG